jgi:hypothetical protein
MVFYTDVIGRIRCLSPDELGSHLSTLRLNCCKDSLVMPDTGEGRGEHKDEEAFYRCAHCRSQTPGRGIKVSGSLAVFFIITYYVHHNYYLQSLV